MLTAQTPDIDAAPATRFPTTYAVTAPVLSMPFHRTSEYLPLASREVGEEVLVN